MKMPSLIAFLPCIAQLTSSAWAADVTEFAPKYRGDVDIIYDVDVARLRLEEEGATVAKQQQVNHELTYAGSFSFFKGAAVFFELPHYAKSAVQYDSAQDMVFDPNQDAGTMIGTDELSKMPSELGGGMGGAWVGLSGTPLHETVYASRSDRVSIVFEGGYRFKDKSNFWSYRDNGVRGAGPGASAWRLGMGFSTTNHASTPYIQSTLIRSGRINMDVTNAAGKTVASNIQVRPASSANMRVGGEIQLGEWGENDSAIALDGHTDFGYIGWQDIPSGIYLPAVLEASQSTTITESEYAYVQLSLGVNWRIMELAQLNIAGEFGTESPHRLEHLYNVSTGLGNYNWGIHTDLRFRVRDSLFEQ